MPKVLLLPVEDEPTPEPAQRAESERAPRKAAARGKRSNVTLLLFLVGCVMLGAGIALGYDMVVAGKPRPRPHIDASTIRGTSFADAPRPVANVGDGGDLAGAGASNEGYVGNRSPEGLSDGAADQQDRGNRAVGERTASGHIAIDFNRLAAYEYVVPGWALLGGLKPEWDTSDEQIPPAVVALSGEQVMLQGFMMPLNLDENRARSFLLVRSFADCCFGCLPTANEWVYVTLTGDMTTGVVNGLPITVYGTFEVGSTTDDEGYMFSLYRMVADQVIGAR